jgi:hypothetical protein
VQSNDYNHDDDEDDHDDDDDDNDGSGSGSGGDKTFLAVKNCRFAVLNTDQ